MRLICPNCGAQYEVDDSVIPDTGRDVQCSNCGHTWFQEPPQRDAGLAAGMDRRRATPAEEPAPSPGAQTEPPTDAGTGEAAAGEEPARSRLDPEVANLLREEAEREAAARRAEQEALETQPDLGLEEQPDRPAPSRSRRGGRPDAGAAPAAAPAAERGSRRELLPDVDEINSTLRASDARERRSEPAPAAEAPEVTRGGRGGGFRRGLMLVVLLAVLAALVYALAPQIAETIPEAAPALAAYVEWVNATRATVDSAVAAALDRLNALIASVTANGGA